MASVSSSTTSSTHGFRCVLIDHYDSFTYNLEQLIYKLVGVFPCVIRHDAKWEDISQAIEDVDAIVLSPGPGHPKNEKDFQWTGRILKENALRGFNAVPIFGVCLGLQGLVMINGGEVVHAAQVIHGRTSDIHHSQCGCRHQSFASKIGIPAALVSTDSETSRHEDSRSVLFRGFNMHFPAVRYNSLIADLRRFPHDQLKIVGWSAHKSSRASDKCEDERKVGHIQSLECDSSDNEDMSYEVMAVEHRFHPHFAVQFHPESQCTPHGAQVMNNFFNFACNYWKNRRTCFPALNTPLSICPSPTAALTTSAGPVLSESKFVLHCERIPFVDSEEVFVHCFANLPFAFWLDSSTLCRHPPQQHQPVGTGTGSGNVHSLRSNRSDERFSYMGPGPLPTGLQCSHASESCYHCQQRLPRLVRFQEHSRTISTYSHTAQLLETRVLSADEDFLNILADILQTHSYSLDSSSSGAFTAHSSSSSSSSLSSGGASVPFPFDCGWVGYFGYEMRHMFQPNEDGRWAKQNSAHRIQPTQTPDSLFLFIDQMIVFDHVEKAAFIVSLQPSNYSNSWSTQMRIIIENIAKRRGDEHSHKLSPSSSRMVNGANPSATVASCDVFASQTCVDDLEFHWRDDRSSYISLIDSCKQFIADGESYELCLTNQLLVDGIRAHPLAIYLQLRNLNPAPYGAYFMVNASVLSVPDSSCASSSSVDALCIVCSSPERFVRVNGGVCESKPIKGTAPRGGTASEDELAAQILAKNEKDRSENLMIVDLIRNDLAQVAKAGSVTVPKLMAVESYATVHQLVSTVRATLKEGKKHVDVIRALFPPGSMTGAPKIRSCAILNGLENGARGIYSGCLGFLSIGGSADFNVVIRTSIAKVQLQKSNEQIAASNAALASNALPAFAAHTSTSSIMDALNSHVLRCSLSLGAGGAIVHLSNADAEYDEVKLKAKASIAAIRNAHQQAVFASTSATSSSR